MDRRNVIIDKKTPEFVGNKNALSKARKDIESICNEMGFISIAIVSKSYSLKLIAYTYNIWQYLKAILKLPFNSNVYIQFPAPFSRTSYYKWLILSARMKGCKVYLIIHDVESLRYNSKEKQAEVAMLNMADAIIVHTEAMKLALAQMGVNVSMIILSIFDYCTNAIMPKELISGNTIAFAGNLEKSPFLQKLINEESDVLYRLYGKTPPFDLGTNTTLEYCGSFSPEQVDTIKASWGLVWDGSSLDTCTGLTGEYLRYNSPHKLSLYIAAGIPVIVWEDSAVAEFVIKHNIGICVKDILSIGKQLNSISKERYEQIALSVQAMATRLRSGSMIKESINRIRTM